MAVIRGGETLILTREAVREMLAGREMDALIAERVMGWRLKRQEPAADDVWYEREGVTISIHEWKPSTEISDAWKVIEHRRSQDWWQEIRSAGGRTGNWIVCTDNAEDPEASRLTIWESPTAPLAICRAALLSTIDPK